MLDLSKLDWKQFELLCAALASAEGLAEMREFGKPGQADRGIDWLGTDRAGNLCILQAKHSARPLAFSTVRRAIVDLQHALSFMKATKAILATSGALTASAAELLAREAPEILLWDKTEIGRLLDTHANVARSFGALASAQLDAEQLIVPESDPKNECDQANHLIARLDGVPPGPSGWRDYEEACIDILNYAFMPPLRPPRIQSRSEDGLDRRDALYTIGAGDAFWDTVRSEFSSRMVVAEFKNHSAPVGQTEVESLQQYLLPSARRSFGILCSRIPPSENAIRARRRAWMIAGNMILFLSDDDLKDIVRRRLEDDSPEAPLDVQLDDFFMKLAP